jgi:hypothetical protein
MASLLGQASPSGPRTRRIANRGDRLFDCMKPVLISTSIITFLALHSICPLFGEEPKGPGQPESIRTKTLSTGAALLQSKTPLGAIHAHVCGFHFYNGDLNRQVIAHHYCSHLSDEMMQCVIYDGDKADSRLIGIEYIISKKLFESLPEEEKKLWHSHNYEVKSGQLTAPGLPEVAEKELMKDLIGTYGKTFHTWQVDRGDKVPLGIPQLMMGFTADGQTNQKLIDDRDAGAGISTADKKEKRADIPDAPISSGANAWSRGMAVQTELRSIEMKGASK